MPITTAQRQTAITLLIQNFGNDAVLSSYIPGLTSATMVSQLVASLGTQFDAAFTTCLNQLVAQTEQNITATQAGITAMQAQVQANTVTP